MNRALLLLVVVLPHASAASIELVARDDGAHGGWYTRGDGAIQGPTLTFAPGETVEVRFRNAGSMAHNLHFGAPLEGVTRLVEPGAETTLVVDVPADASGGSSYWCDPHRQLGMSGKVRFETPPTPTAAPSPSPTPVSPTAPEPRETPWNAIVLTLLAAATVATVRRRDRQG